MAGKIGVTTADLTKLSSDIKAQAEQARTLLQAVTTKVNSVNTAWDGAAQSTFVAEYTQMKPTLDKFPVVLDGIGKQLADVAAAFAEMDSKISSALKK